MNKITKLLSVFVIAGAVASGAGALAGCKKHTHTFKEDEWGGKDATNHWHVATCEHEDEKKDVTPHGTANSEGKCPDCGYQLTTPMPSNPTTVHVTGITLTETSGTIKKGETKKLEYTIAPSDATNKNVSWLSDNEAVATVAEDGTITAVEVGTAKITVTTADSDKQAVFELTVESDKSVRDIKTVEDFLAFRALPELSGEYKLGANLDLTGVEVPAPVAVIGEGVTFDGQGYTISNMAFTSDSNKLGLLCASVEGGTVKNVKFLSCSISLVGESAGIVTGLCEGGTFSQIEFNGCNATTNNTYVGLLFARNTQAGTINISEITAKNGCFTSCSQYGGFVMGDMVSGTKVSMSNMDIAGEFKTSSGNGSFVFGRVRAGECSIENSVIRSAKVATPTKNGLITGGTKADKLTIKNVLVVDTDCGLLVKEGKEGNIPTGDGALTIENYVAVTGLETEVQSATAVDGENTVAYLTTLGLDFTADTGVWMAEGEGYRLRSGSTNLRSEGSTVVSVSVNAAAANVRFKKGEDFDAGTLGVVALFSDNLQLPLQEGADEGYEIDSSAYDKTKKGEYTIVIKSKEDPTKTAEYKVNVVEETGFKVYDEHMAHVYVPGAKLDSAKLVVKSVWSDGVEENVAAKNYTVDCDLAAVGEKTVKITYGEYTAQEVKVSVVDTKPVAVDGKIYINVDGAITDYSGKKDAKGIETFKSVHDAVKFLEACKYDKSVEKVIRIAPGTYYGRIETNLSNLSLIGTGEKADDVKITYSAVESTIDLLTGQPYVMKCATVYVVGDGFQAHNIAIRNDFDYIENTVSKKESSPQGIALTVEGDGTIINDCHIYGNQDTIYMRKGRAYFKNTQIDGNVDFICGEADAILFFDECKIVAINRYTDETENKSNQGYVIAMKGDEGKVAKCGVVFNKCEFTSDEKVGEGTMSLARTWGKNPTVAFVECSYTKAYSKLAYGTKSEDGKTTLKARWEAMSNASPANAKFVEIGGTGDGAITTAVTGGTIETDKTSYAVGEIFKKDNYTEGTTAAFEADWTPDITSVTGLKDLVAPTGVYVSTEAIEIEAGKTAELLVAVAPWNANDKTATITVVSDNEDVAKWEDGVVTGVAKGTAKLTVSDGTNSKEVTVTVTADADTPEPVKHTYTFVKSEIDTAVEADESIVTKKNDKLDQGTIRQGVLPGESNSFLTIVGTVQYREAARAYIECKDAGLELEFKGTGTLTIQFASTGDANKSRFGLLNAAGEYVEATSIAPATEGQGTVVAVEEGDEAGAYECGGNSDGSKTITAVFTITEAGKYKITCPSSATNRGARIISVVMEDNYADESSTPVTPAPANVLEKFFVTSDDERVSSATFTADTPFSWDEKGIIKLYSATDKQWSTDDNGKKYTDINGTEHTAVKRLKANSANPYITIDLTDYEGEYTLTFAFAPGNTERTAQLAAEGEDPVYTIDNTTNKDYVGNATATLEGGKVYKFTWTNAYNFYYMGIVPKA